MSRKIEREIRRREISGGREGGREISGGREGGRKGGREGSKGREGGREGEEWLYVNGTDV